MLIAQISDTHISQHGDAEREFPERVKSLEAFVRHINALDQKPDLVLHTGDVTHGGQPEDYETAKTIMKDISIPVYFALGNRDLGKNLVAGLKDLGGADLGAAKLVDGFVIYSIDGFPVRLIAMDTHHREHNIGTTCSVRLGVLDELLKQQPDQPTALFMHHPPFEVTTSKYPFQFDDQVLADSFLGLIAQHKQIKHLFCGHMHRQYSVQLETCRASCVPSLPPDNRLGEFEPELDGKPLYQLHSWNADTARFETKLSAATLPT
ncbi:MAG: metallophosphoesterase [Rhodospirillaceae bacterium]|nr:metallophosphoesterase [Rhodospirillaceae bacterium]